MNLHHDHAIQTEIGKSMARTMQFIYAIRIARNLEVGGMGM